ncbi:MAG: FkbM family methyltransferase [Deltaproteobacteria bacterium]|nr:FkbM family methyltransferase [Deltaproteobacteria bacterium]
MKQALKTLYSHLPLKRELFTVLRSVYSPPKSVYQHLHFRGPFTVPMGERKFLIHHYGTNVENILFWEGLSETSPAVGSDWEGVSLALWMKLCQKSRFVLDVGANTGVFSLIAKTMNPAAEVHAFEPVTRVYERLCANNKLNGFDIHCVEKALSNFDGQAEVYDTFDEHTYSVTVNKNLHDPWIKTRKVIIKTVRLDTYLEALGGNPKIDLIKLDVETHEPEVLEGMGPYLMHSRPPMLVEVLSDEIAARVEELVKDLGYLYFNISEVGKPRHQKHLSKSDHFNFLLCDQSRAAELGLET